MHKCLDSDTNEGLDVVTKLGNNVWAMDFFGIYASNTY